MGYLLAAHQSFNNIWSSANDIACGPGCAAVYTGYSTTIMADAQEQLDLDEPAAVDDVYISVDEGVGIQPFDRPSVMAGFVAAVRLHIILERT